MTNQHEEKRLLLAEALPSLANELQRFLVQRCTQLPSIEPTIEPIDRTLDDVAPVRWLGDHNEIAARRDLIGLQTAEKSL